MIRPRCPATLILECRDILRSPDIGGAYFGRCAGPTFEMRASEYERAELPVQDDIVKPPSGDGQLPSLENIRGLLSVSGGY
jgi:hypothetical protein